MRLVSLIVVLCALAPARAQPFPSARAVLDAATEAGAVVDPAARAAAVDALWARLGAGQATSRVPFAVADTAVFLWRGTAASVAIAGDHTSWNPTANLVRQGQSDLWVRVDRFDPAARVDYKVVVNGADWRLDAANPHRQMSGFGPNSELRMPAWTPEPLTVRDPTTPRGALSAPQTITSPAYPTAPVTYRVWTPAGYDASTDRLPTVYVTDGHEYADDALGAMTTVLDNLVAQGRIEPLVAVFIDPRSGGQNRRQEQYVMNAGFASLVAEALVPAIDAAYRTRTDRTSRAILGTSLGGLFSAYLGATHAETFGLLAIHSPAFWADPTVYALVAQTTPGAFRVAMTAGTINDTAPAARRMRDVLTARGDAVSYTEVPEGHSWGNWRALIDDVLVPLFPPRPVGAEAAPAETGALRLEAIPNPSRAATLRVTLAQAGPARVTCADTTGRTVLDVTRAHAAGTHELTLPGLAAGVYVCRLTAAGAWATRTITVIP